MVTGSNVCPIAGPTGAARKPQEEPKCQMVFGAEQTIIIS
jgi:hypothetical protein